MKLSKKEFIEYYQKIGRDINQEVMMYTNGMGDPKRALDKIYKKYLEEPLSELEVFESGNTESGKVVCRLVFVEDYNDFMKSQQIVDVFEEVFGKSKFLKDIEYWSDEDWKVLSQIPGSTRSKKVGWDWPIEGPLACGSCFEKFKERIEIG